LDESFQIFKGAGSRTRGGASGWPRGKSMSLKEILGFDWLLQGNRGTGPDRQVSGGDASPIDGGGRCRTPS